MPILDNSNDTPNQHYHNRDEAHAIEVNYENNRYITPVNVEFGSTESDNTVHIVSKHCNVFAAIKLLDRSAKIITNDDTVISPWESIMQQISPSSMIAKSNFHVFSSASSSILP